MAECLEETLSETMVPYLSVVFPFPYIPFQLTETFMIIVHSEQRGNALEEHYKQF